MTFDNIKTEKKLLFILVNRICFLLLISYINSWLQGKSVIQAYVVFRNPIHNITVITSSVISLQRTLTEKAAS